MGVRYQFHLPASLLHRWGRRCRYALDIRLGESQSQAESFGEEKSLFSILLTDPRSLDTPARSVASGRIIETTVYKINVETHQGYRIVAGRPVHSQ